MRFRWLALAVLGVALAGCRSKEGPAPAPSTTVAEVPAPASLLAELSLGNPKETWQRLRVLGGDLAQALPSSLPVLLTTSLSFPPAAAGSLDEALPMVGAVLAREGAAEPDVVVGMHVLSGPELVASLTLGDSAKFRRVEVAPRLVRLLPAPGAPEFNGALGVSGNYLLVATRIEALKDAGRFVAETIAKRATNQPGLSLRAGERILKGTLARTLRESWRVRRQALLGRAEQQRQAKGRAPDFAEPEVLLEGVDNTVEALLDVLESSKELGVAIVPEADRLRVELSLLPAAEGAASLLAKEMVLGAMDPLLQLPSSTRAALLLRGEERSKDGAAGLSQSLAHLFGERLKPEQATKLRQTLDAFAQTRRGATVIGIVGTPSPALVATFELHDEKAFSATFADVLKLVELGPVSGWLAGTVGKPALELLPSEGSTRHARLRFARAAGAGSLPIPKTLQLSWEARAGVGYVVVAPDTKGALSLLAEPARLGGSAWLQKSHTELGGRTALGVYLDAGLLAPGGPDDAPALLVLAKRGDRIVLGAELAAASLRAASSVLR